MQPHRPNPHPARAQHGFALLEVLIAVVVLAIGLLGMAALQSSALRNNQSSLERTQAVILSYSILEAMRANLTVARAGTYNMAATSTVPATGATLVSKDLNAWMTDVQASLNDPAATGAIVCAAPVAPDPSRVCAINITWNDSRGGLNQVANAADAAKTVTTVGRL